MIMIRDEKKEWVNASEFIKNIPASGGLQACKVFIKDKLWEVEVSNSEAQAFIFTEMKKHFHLNTREINNLTTYFREQKEEKALNAKKALNSIKPPSTMLKMDVPVNANYEKMEWNQYIYPNEGKNCYAGSEEEVLLYGGDFPRLVSRTPFVLCGKAVSQKTGAVYYTIRCGHDQKEFIAGESDLLQKNTLKGILTTHSINVPDNEMLNRALEYISCCIHFYGEKLKVSAAVETNGWNEDNSVFAIGNNGITENGLVPVYTTLTNPKHVNVFRPMGTEEDWVKIVTPILDYDLVRFLYYDAMTAPLIKILGVEGHAYEHIGKTRGGKTTISCVIASAIGNPFEQMLNPANSSVGITAHVSAMCDIPTFIEEVTTRKAKGVVKSAVYEIANGMERARGRIDGKMREDIKVFRAVTHVTAEGSIREEMTHAGEMYRLNTMEEMIPFDDRIGEIRKKVQGNYGHFFIRYIQKIFENKDVLRAMHDKFNKLIIAPDNDNLVESSKDLYAGIMVAGWLCEEVFRDMGVPVKDSQEIVLNYFKKCVLSEEVELDHIRALRALNTWVYQNKNSFLNGGSEIPDSRIKEVLGVITDKEIRIVNIERVLKDLDFNSPTNIIKCLHEEGITRTNNHKKGKCVFKFNGGTHEGLVINIEAMRKHLDLLKED